MEGIAKLLFLMFLGGLIAYLGDRTGKYIGKKKLTIFNLRPRYTSQILTVAFGMLIPLMTLLILSTVSKDVRQTLFQVHSLEAKRQKLEKDISQLTKITTLNEVVFHVNQPIVMGAIQGGRGATDINQDLSQLLAKANEVAVMRSSEARNLQSTQTLAKNEQLILYQKEDLEKTTQILSKNPKNFVVLIYALRNTYLNEQVLVQFNVRENKRIYRASQVLLSIKIDGKEPQDQILVDLFNLLSQLQQTALDAGMIPDPVTNNFGGNILVATLFNKRDQIKQINGKSLVNVIANRDLYMTSPLDVRFNVRPIKK